MTGEKEQGCLEESDAIALSVQAALWVIEIKRLAAGAPARDFYSSASSYRVVDIVVRRSTVNQSRDKKTRGSEQQEIKREKEEGSHLISSY